MASSMLTLGCACASSPLKNALKYKRTVPGDGRIWLSCEALPRRMAYAKRRVVLSMAELDSSKGDSQQVGRRNVLQTIVNGALISHAFGATTLASLAGEEYMEVAGTAIQGERFDPEEFVFEVPSTWRYLPKLVKRGRVLLYTDTYGPNYVYSEKWPNFKDGSGPAFSRLEVLVTSSMGRTTIEDLGPPENIEVSKAFGLSDLELAEVTFTQSRDDEAGTKYYEWDLETGDGRALVAATISGGAIYALNVVTDEQQWERNSSSIEHLRQSFTVIRSGGFLYDTNTRLNRRRSSGKASADFQSL